MLISKYNQEQIRLTMKFDNGTEYIAITDNTTDNILEAIHIVENESNNNGNPLGVMSSNSINFSIYDARGVLIQSNTSSPYYGYMRNGVLCLVEWRDNSGVYHPLGTYYTNSWNTTREDGGYKTIELSAQDKLNYIGNLNIPELPAFASIQIRELIRSIFIAIGLSESDYIIDETLNLELTFSIARGAKLRDTLNNIAQALIARITINRLGVIEVKPAFPTQPADIDELDSEYIISESLAQNQYTNYSAVQLSYYELGIQNSVTLATVNDIVVVPGENSFDNIKLNNQVQGIDLVTFEYTVTPENYNNAINDINYTGYQGGISVKINSSLTDNVIGTIIVEGRETGDSEVILSRDILGADRKVANILMLNSDYIQNRVDANNYLDKVVKYIETLRGTANITSILSMEVNTGKYVSLNSDNPALDGVYYIQGINIDFEEGFNLNIEAVKVS